MSSAAPSSAMNKLFGAPEVEEFSGEDDSSRDTVPPKRVAFTEDIVVTDVDNTLSDTATPEQKPAIDDLPRMTPERKAYVCKALKRAIPILANQRKQVIKKNAAYCKLCILDAFQGRLSNGLANNSKKSWWIYTIFCFQTSDWMFKAVLSASVLHTFSIFFEPADSCLNSWIFKLFQYLVMVIYAIDIGLKMGYEGPQEYFRHDWQQLYVINLVAGVVDLLVCGCTTYSNPLRPLAGLLRARKGRKFFEVLKKMVPGMTHNLIPILFFVVITMGLCSLLFDTLIDDYKSVSFSFYNWWYLVLTNDTFDRLLPENLFVDLTYLLFFFPAIYVGQRFLLSLIIGDTYNTFRSFVKKQLKKERMKEMQGLVKAFFALDENKTGLIPDLVWRECMTALNPELSQEAIALYYELISGGNESISVLQFLSLRNILSFKLSFAKKSQNRVMVMYRKNKEKCMERYNNIKFHLDTKIIASGQTILKALDKYEIVSRTNFADIAVLCFGYSEYPLGGGLTPCTLIGCIYVVEFLIRLIAADGKISSLTKSSNMVSSLFVCGCIATLLFYPLVAGRGLDVNAPYSFPLLSTVQSIIANITSAEMFVVPNLPIRKLILVFRLLRCLRIANLNEDLQNFNAALFDVIPALFETFSFTFIVSYMFGTLGNLLFGAYMDEWKTPLLGVVKAQQLTFMVNFLGSMEAAMESVHPAASIYFLVYLIMSLTVSNIALSIIIDLHANVLDMKTNEREGQKKKIDIVFEKIVAQARARRVIHTTNQGLNFLNIKLSEFQTSDVRHFITQGEGGDTIKVSDLESCQKYAKIDLVKFYNEQHRQYKDINWEVDVLKTMQDTDLHEEKDFEPGEEIFTAGDPAKFLYVLTQGSVRISRSSGNDDMQHEDALFYSTNFLGAECLQPNGKYSLSCTAEHETKCLIFKQDDVAHGFASDIAGSVLKLAHKSWTQVETAFAEARKKSRRFSINTTVTNAKVDLAQLMGTVQLQQQADASSGKNQQD